MTYEQVVQGIGKYIVREILPTMNTWQQIMSTIVVDRYMKNSHVLKQSLMNNPMVKPLGIIDENGNVDVDGLINDIKNAMSERGNIEFTIPIIGCKYRFSPDDIERLRGTIKEGGYENHQGNG